MRYTKLIGTLAVASFALLPLACSKSGSNSAYCDAFEEAQDEIERMETLTEPTVEDMDDIIATVEDVAADAPEEIADTFDEFLDALNQLRDVLETAETDPEAAAEMIAEMSELENTLTNAGEEIDNFTEEECDVEIED